MSANAVIQGLIARGMSPHIAYGVAGNMQVESDGFQTDVNEYAPLVPGSRGGYGLNQWTGPRRRQFEAFAEQRGVNPADLDTQLDFTMWELENTEQRAGRALQSAQTPADAARIYSEKFLRPGIPHLERRIQAANALAGGGHSQSALPQGQANQLAMQGAPQGYGAPQGQNALAQQPKPPEFPQGNMLRVADFQTKQTPYQIQRFT